MATASVTQGTGSGIGIGGAMQAMQLPFISAEVVTFTTSTQSAVFGAYCNMIAVTASADARIRVGTNPTAVAADMLIKSGVTYFFSVPPGQRLAIYDGSS